MLFFDFYRWRGNEARIIQMIRQKISRYRRSISFWHRVEMASWNNSLELRLFKWKWTDFIYDNHWPELYYLLNLFSVIAGKAFIIEFFSSFGRKTVKSCDICDVVVQSRPMTNVDKQLDKIIASTWCSLFLSRRLLKAISWRRIVAFIGIGQIQSQIKGNQNNAKWSRFHHIGQ